MAANRVGRIAFSTSVLTPDDPDAFDRALVYVRDWLARQAVEFNLEPLSGHEPLEQRKNEAARLIAQQTPDSLSFAFAHTDQHDDAISWHVLAALTKRDGRAQVDVEVAAEGVGPPVIPPLGMPGFMAGLVSDVGLLDCRRLSVAPVPITRSSAGEFAEFLFDPNRTLPVVAFSQPLSLTTEEVQRISKRLAGAAHIALIESDASFLVSDRIGKEYSVYQGAVRVYTPNPPRNPYQIKLYFPATIQKYNAEERGNGPFGTIRFADVLVRAALDRRMWPITALPAVVGEAKSAQQKQTAGGTLEVEASAAIVQPQESLREPAPALEVSEAMTAIVEEAKKVESPPESAATVGIAPANADRIEDLERKLAAAQDARDRAEMERDKFQTEATKNEEEWFNAQAELEQLQQRFEALDSPLVIPGITEADAAVLKSMQDAFLAMKSMIERTTASEAAASQMRSEMDDLRKEVGRQRLLIEGLQRRDRADVDKEVVRPARYDDADAVEEYLRKRHQDKLILHSNARRTLEEGRFEDHERLLDMLELLGTLHHAMKTADGEDGRAYEAFNGERERLHVKYSRALSETSFGTHGRHYEVMWEGRKIDASDIWHIRCLGTTYEPERMAALYFFWDPERKTTVITSGPEKLPTPADHT